MTWKSAWLGAMVIAMLSCGAARAGEEAAKKPADDEAVLRPFLDDTIVIVIRIDVSSLDFKTEAQWALPVLETAAIPRPILGEMKEDVLKRFDEWEHWAARFRAAGGKRIYFVDGLSNLEFTVIPIEAGADANALVRLYPDDAIEGAEVIGNAVIVADDKTRQHLKQLPPQKPRPELADAFAAAGKAPISAVYVPSALVRQTMETAAPQLPESIGGGSIRVLSQGMRWIALGIRTPPQPSMRITVQCEDAQAARKLFELYGIAAKVAIEKSKEMIYDVKAAVESATPKIDKDQIIFALDEAQLRHLVSSNLRVIPLKFASGEWIQKLTFAVGKYSVDHGNQWPQSLDLIARSVGGKAALKEMLSPFVRAGKTGRVTYRKPIEPIKDGARTIVVYESFDKGGSPPFICAGFADGHMEWIAPDDLKKRLEVGAPK